MLHRSFTTLILVSVIAASGLGGAVLHLCGMENALRWSCCCHQANHDAPPAQLKALDECCGTPFVQDQQPPVAEARALRIDSSPLAAPVASVLPVRHASVGGDCALPSVRGPPLRYGPPLFLQYCSFLN